MQRREHGKPAIGDSVEFGWGDGRSYPATVERVSTIAVWLRVSGPIEATMVVPLTDLREIGPNRWAFGG